MTNTVTTQAHQQGQQSMTARQKLAIATCVALNALDGFDVLSISFASPGIAREWGIDRAALGVVLSMELLGMAVGSVLLGQLADRIGRREIVFGSLVVMAFGMFSTTQVSSVGALSATRLLTGLGIGGMLATINAMASEYASDRWRGTAVAVMAAGYPLGAVLGGLIANHLLATGGWRQVFWLGAIMTTTLIPIVPFLLPEPVGSLLQRRPADALARVNWTLRALGQSEITQLPDVRPDVGKGSPAMLFSPALRRTTLLLVSAYFLHIMTFYFILKWVPKIVADMGFSPALAGDVLVWANVGGLCGAILFSLLSIRLPLRPLLAGSMIAATTMVIVFGLGHSDLAGLSWAAASAGFFTNAAVVGLYALAAQSFPTSVRAGGTGIVIGIGRAGSALGPIAGGLLFQVGFGLPAVATIMAMGSLIGAIAVLSLPKARVD
jgi:benzoate transport